MKRTVFLSFLAISLAQSLFSGLHVDTLVHTPLRLTSLQSLSVYSQVVTRNGDRDEVRNITHKRSRFGHDCVCLVVAGEQLIVAADQKMYVPQREVWQRADQLVVGDALYCSSGDWLPIESIYAVTGDVELCDITVAQTHNFYVTKHGILAHNMAQFVVIAAPCVAPALAPVAGCAVGAGLLWYFINSRHQSKNKNSAREKARVVMSAGGAPGGPPKKPGSPDDNENDFFGTDKEKEEKKRVENKISKKEFFESVANDYYHLHSGIYKLGKGKIPVVKNAEYLQWDNLHGDVEVYNKSGKHQGSLDPFTRNLYKLPVKGRTINV
jgi:hypothetical protein